MFLFILESLGTSELLLMGILALVLLGPRKLPEIARMAGKIMAEFRGTAAEFKETWQREVNFEEEFKALREINFNDEADAFRLDNLDEKPISEKRQHEPEEIEPPLIRDADPAKFEGFIPTKSDSGEEGLPIEKDKKSWL